MNEGKMREIVKRWIHGTHCCWPLCGKNRKGGYYCEEHQTRAEKMANAAPNRKLLRRIK